MSRILTRFPQGFHWGAATSAHQVEGGNRGNDWWRFEQQPGAIRGGARSGDACRHWERFDQDFARARDYGHTMHRLSLEWSRIEPARGRRDTAAIAHYHEVFASLKRHGLTPLVTLHHFTNPLWIADAGGDGRAAFVGFAKHLPQFVPDRPWFLPDVVRASIEDRVFNTAVPHAAVTGDIALSIPGVAAVNRHVPELEKSLDYIGLNYYTRWWSRCSGSAERSRLARP